MRFKGGYKYQLVENTSCETSMFPHDPVKTEFIDVSRDGVLTVKSGYAWDGPSGEIPLIKLPITADTKTFMRGSLFHDALYQLMREGYLLRSERKAADKVLRRICIEDGMWKVRAWWVYKAVRLGAANSAKNGRKIRTAP